MFFSNYKKRGCTGSRLAAAVLAGVLTVSAVVAEPLTVVAGAQKEDVTLPSGGLIGFTTERAVHVASDDAGGSSTLKSIRPQLRQYDWDGYSSDYYYSKLSAKEQLLYERLDAACGELLTSQTVNAETYQIGGAKRRGTKEVSTLGLTVDQVKKVQTLFIYSNPQYYFLNTILFTTDSNTCALGLYDSFASGGSRASATQQVLTGLEKLQERIFDNGCTYETEAQIHELLCDELTYMDGENVLRDKTDPYYTQTIYGALMTGKTVCAGYTKLYTMLCNYYGIDCIAVTSNDHAWNQVRYGDHWYLVDVTWDDSRDRGKFFHITDSRMKATDQNNSHVVHSYYDGIRPVADTEFSGDLMLMSGLEQPQVEIKDTAPGVTITMSSDVGDVYYTLDGSVPGTADLYTEPVALTDSGTYVVTAMTAAPGMISSAYEIFTVRIAGGSASISSAVNTSGRKIKVKFKSAKSYTGYEISYASKRDFSNQKSLKVKNKAVTISGLKKGKTYYIRVRGYKRDAYGNYYYTSYSKTKKVTVTK